MPWITGEDANPFRTPFSDHIGSHGLGAAKATDFVGARAKNRPPRVANALIDPVSEAIGFHASTATVTHFL